jgi:SAM-dependent methyltransferase
MSRPSGGGLRMPWPLPALATWAASWAVFIVAMRWIKLPTMAALLLAAGLAIVLSLREDTRWRRLFIAWGFPLSLGASGLVGDVPPWVWLMPLALLAVVYPIRSWSDAPLFPTPEDALAGLSSRLVLPRQARILDAGCGLGHGLLALHREYPQASVVGLEWSWPLRLYCGWRMAFASVRRADMWTADWSGYDMVYLFQRSDSMPRAALKAGRELRPGAWLASLEFEVAEWRPTEVHACPDGRRVWLYQAPFRRR